MTYVCRQTDTQGWEEDSSRWLACGMNLFLLLL